MPPDTDLWYLLPEPLRRLPADLWAVVGITLATVLAAVTPGLRETPLRVAFGLAFVLFVPGYAFVAALFPERGPDRVDDRPAETDPSDTGGIDGIERVALSFGTSIAIVPLLGLVLNFTPWGIRLLPILIAVGGFTLAATAVAARRRRALSPDDRFEVPYAEWVDGARSELLEPQTRTDAALNVLLVVSVVLATASVAYAVAVPKQGEAFTELYLLTENETGELVADDYPTEFVRGESRPVVVGIGNHEHRPMNYTVVVELHRVAVENNSTRLLDQQRLNRFRVHVDRGGTWRRQFDVTPRMTGERLRLAYLLYKGEAPPDPRVANADLENHLWINATMNDTQNI